jgi:hypothetical protein
MHVIETNVGQQAAGRDPLAGVGMDRGPVSALKCRLVPPAVEVLERIS